MKPLFSRMKKANLRSLLLFGLVIAAGCDPQTIDLAAARDSSQTDGGAEAGSADADADADAALPEEPDLTAFLARAGDGDQAYRKIADVWCERIEACENAAQSGKSFADHDTCMRTKSSDLAATVRNLGCDYRADVHIEPLNLARCLHAFSEASCPRLPNYLYQALMRFADHGILKACVEASADALFQEDALRKARALGEGCDSHGDCGVHSHCDAPRTGGCGVCRLNPRQGEPCVDPTDDGSFCDFGFECGEDMICRRVVAGEGESCSGRPCQRGLECDYDSVCRQLHREGDTCHEAAGCGSELTCLGGVCTFVVAGALGTWCDGAINNCYSGVCRDGQCVEAPGLGETCAPPDADCSECAPTCLSPYVCKNNVCVEGPACEQGQAGDACEVYWQCEGGACLAFVLQCSEVPAYPVGEACNPVQGCERGVCTDGICVLLEAGATCAGANECWSGVCAHGVCMDMVCESA